MLHVGNGNLPHTIDLDIGIAANMCCLSRRGSPSKSQRREACNKKLHRIIDTVDLGEDVKFHRCRHTFATLLIDDKVDPKTVAELLGHANVITTLNIYWTVSDDAKEAAIATLDGFYESSS